MHQIIFFFLFCFFFSCSIPEDHNNDSSRIVILSDQIKKDPFNTSLLLERANYNIKRNNLESAIFDLKQCVSIDSVNFDFRYILSKLYFDLSKELHANSKYPELSRIHIIQALNINNTDYKANSLYGELLLSYAKYKEAVKYFNISLDNNYNQERVHMLLGYAYKKLNREEDAISCFENAILNLIL